MRGVHMIGKRCSLLAIMVSFAADNSALACKIQSGGFREILLREFSRTLNCVFAH